MKKIALVGIFSSAFIVLNAAYAADLQRPQKGGMCYGISSGYECEYLGKVTIKQIYEKGWRVVAYIKEGDNLATLIIEEQR